MAEYTQQLPVKPETGGRITQGYATPVPDKTPQKMSIPPRRVIPIIFLPGIMGSNLRLKPERQALLKRQNNVAWRPDQFFSDPMKANEAAKFTPAMRQLMYDPDATEVDTYEPDSNPTGNPREKADQRHANVKLHIESPLLVNDPPAASPWQSRTQKARARGWGEVLFASYGELLQRCEERLNTAFLGGKLDPRWNSVVGIDPQQWQHEPDVRFKNFKLGALTEDELRQALNGCWFPVHAVGYNWLQSNRESGIYVAERIRRLMADYNNSGFQCEKVIVVTHSMGGLVGRALIHPDMGNFNDQVLGMIHGVMPAIGAGAAYRRMRCGFEGNPLSASIPGNYGDEVTAVLANAPGALELLPTKDYGSEWLQVVHRGVQLKCLPKPGGDPYEEIYKLRGKWYGLLREEWISAAKNIKRAGYDRTAGYLDRAKRFHEAIAGTYHRTCYAHYGADSKRPAWHQVIWAIDGTAYVDNIEKLKIVDDNRQGQLRTKIVETSAALASLAQRYPQVHISSLMANDPGDQTVPQHSADHQLLSGKFKGIFHQHGYEHQGSYQDEAALACTLYCLVRIIQNMTWSS